MSAAIAPPAAPRPARRRRWLRWSLIVLLIFVGLPAGYYFYARWSLERELAEVIAETDRLDPRWRLEDIEADRKTYRDEENAALKVMKASGLIGGRVLTAHRDHAILFDKLSSEAQLNAQQFQYIREAFDTIPAALIEARKLKDLPAGRFPLTYKPNWIGTYLSAQQNSHGVSDLLLHDAMLLAQQGDPDGALDSCMALLNVARALGDEPLLWSFGIRLSRHNLVVTATERVLAQGFPTEKQLSELQERLRRERGDLRVHWTATVRGERAGHHQIFLAVGRRELQLSHFRGGRGKYPLQTNFWDSVRDRLPILTTKDYPRHLRAMNQVVAAAKQPMQEQRERFQSWQKAIDRDNRFTIAFAPDLLAYCEGHLRTQADLAAAQASLACERFRIVHKRWPESLADLINTGKLDGVPIDPFDGQPMRYRTLKDGVAVYSVGYDNEDNGGNINRDRPLDKGVDLGFRLWDPEQRRQPPRPPVALEK